MDLIWGQCLLYRTKDLYHNTTSNLIDLKHILKGTKVMVYNHNHIVFLTRLPGDLRFSAVFFSLFPTGSEKLSETHLFVTSRLQLYFG